MNFYEKSCKSCFILKTLISSFKWQNSKVFDKNHTHLKVLNESRKWFTLFFTKNYSGKLFFMVNVNSSTLK